MNTLSTKTILNKLSKWQFLRTDISKLSAAETPFCASRENLHGSFMSAFIALYIQERKLLSLSTFNYKIKNNFSQEASRKSRTVYDENTITSGIGTHSAKKYDSRDFNALIIVPTEFEADSMALDFRTFFPEAEVNVMPAWETIPYRASGTGNAVFGKRAAFLSRISTPAKNIVSPEKQRPRIFIATERIFITPLPPPSYSASLSFSLEKGQNVDIIKIAEKAAMLGYIKVNRVTVTGEFSLRGEVLDIFPPGYDNAVRITLDFDTIETIKFFDTDSQVTEGVTDNVRIFPMKEVVWNDELLHQLIHALDEYKKTAIDANTTANASIDANTTTDANSADATDNVHLPFTDEAEKTLSRMLDALSTKSACEGEELLYPLIWKEKYSLLDYITPETTVFFADSARLENGFPAIMREYNAMYRKTRLEFPSLPPDIMTIPFDALESRAMRKIKFNTFSAVEDGADLKTENTSKQSKDVQKIIHNTLDNHENTSKLSQDVQKSTHTAPPTTALNALVASKHSEQLQKNIHYNVDSARSFFGNINYLKETIEASLAEGWNIFVYTDGDNQALRMKSILGDYDINILPSMISAGFAVSDIKLLVMQENEVFGRKRKIPKSLARAKSSVIDTFVELNTGDFVVHVNYGIGKFLGIERVKSMGHERDYIKIEYAGEEFAFVPIEQVNLVQRYIGGEGNAPRLDHIGSKSWENRKNRVNRAVEELAEKLVDLYSRRKAMPGIPFPKDTEWQTAFEAAFPYEDTPDQITVTDEIKADMEKSMPMDRLICGDVGYGKTELAMRAAFKAIMGGRQVAFLSPTTILAEQHYETCTERFKNFPVRIALLSRFVSRAEQKKILADVKSGDIDLVIGTHRIIQKDVQFKKLGLIIIDEEQRFGVKDKERLKEMRTNVDCLSMSATPIPRTLHMSLLKIRDMSVLATPPQNRQPIETEISSYSDEKVARAIRNEVERGGQVFFLHNRVESLLEVRLKLERLLPEMLIETANGQMSGDELEDIFRRFKMGGFHILVATTIIENGIDIPNVNTIIIDRADMYGVSQLYQLRGRVGRSDRKAYAYLFYPENASLTEVAMKRLQAISDFTELGSGFKIAMKDMEIRGAGNLLGKDQSGDVYAVGFDLYLHLLNRAIEKILSSGEYSETGDVMLELEYTGFIPAEYIENTETKMEVYKKIAGVQNEAELSSVQAEIEDRFGPAPEEVMSLLSLAEIRIQCRRLNISQLIEKKGIVQIEFAKVSDISVDKVLSLIKSSAGAVSLSAEKPNMIFLKTGNIGLKEKSEYIREKLSALAING